MNLSIYQVLVGILFLILGGLDINDPDHQKTADILNNTATVMTMMMILMMMMMMMMMMIHQNNTATVMMMIMI